MLTDVLLYMRRSPNGNVFRGTLAVAGVDGSLKRRMTEEGVRGRVFAKTGYLSGATGLSGYAETQSGKLYAFSILVNDFTVSYARVRNILDDVARALVSE